MKFSPDPQLTESKTQNLKRILEPRKEINMNWFKKTLLRLYPYVGPTLKLRIILITQPQGPQELKGRGDI